MTIFCIHMCEVPSRSAHSLAIMKQCEAIARSGKKVVLICHRNVLDRKATKEDIFSYYGITYRFPLLVFPVFKRMRTLVFTLQMLLFLLTRQEEKTVYTREIKVAGITSFLGYDTIVELHSQYSKANLYQRWTQRPFLLMLKPKYIVRTIAISEVLKNILLREGVFTNIMVLPSGADKPAVSLPVTHTDPLFELEVGYVGHLTAVKNIDLIVELAATLPRIRFNIVGGIEKDIQYWLGKIKNSGVKNVVFHGYKHYREMSRYLHGFDVCLVTTCRLHQLSEKYERETVGNGSPLKLFNYMAHGKAIICSDRPEYREVINTNQAIFCCPDNSAEWKDAILYLRDNADQRRQMGASALYEFEKNYTWDKRAQHIFDFRRQHENSAV